MKSILFMFILVPLLCPAQGRNSIWIFGDSAGIDFRNLSIPAAISSGMDGRGSCLSLSDTNGNLVLYAATMPYVTPLNAWSTKVFNSQHQFVQGCDSITGVAWYNELIMFPKPEGINTFDLFSIGLAENVNQGLYQSTIDMSLNGGLGAVVVENKQISSELFADCLNAVKHGNGRDWWVLGKLNTSPPLISHFNRFFVFMATTDSVFDPLIFDFNDHVDVGFQKIIWHPSFNSFMLINTRGYMSEFNFDRCDGTISMNRNIYPEQTSNFSRVFLEGAYSPNGNVFYVSRNSYGGNFGNYNYLLQYDLTAPNIPASCDTLDSTSYLPVDCGAVRLAPDGKIYYSQAYISSSVLSYPYADSMRNSINENLGVIHNPDIVGPGCDFRPFSFYLGGKRTYYGLPNNPKYDLGPLVGSICDSLTLGIAEQKVELVYSLYPNPCVKAFTLFCNASLQQPVEVFVFDQLGRELLSKTINTSISAFDVESFSDGPYYLKIQNGFGSGTIRFVKMKD